MQRTLGAAAAVLSLWTAVGALAGERRGTLFQEDFTKADLELGATVEEIMEWHHLTREQIVTVLEFAARSLDAPVSHPSSLMPA